MLSNKANAGVLDIAHAAGVATRVFNRQEFYETRRILEELQAMEIDFLVLAGFLWLAPSYLVQAFPGRIVNIHPALLPQYGGKGMYGMHVHEAVKAAGEKASGMSIHFVDEYYDEGNIIFQVKCSISDTDTAADLPPRY